MITNENKERIHTQIRFFFVVAEMVATLEEYNWLDKVLRR